MKCPIQCGQCCEMWRDVEELAEKHLSPLARLATKVSWECPHQRKNGCSLKRKNRPKACTGYLCDIATAVINKEISLKRGRYFKEQGMNFLPTFLRDKTLTPIRK